MIYIMGFVNIDGSYDVSPLHTLVVTNWIFTLWSFVLSDWMFRYETHDVCLMVWILEVTMGYHIDSLDVCYGTQTCGFPRWYWGNLCIGVDALFIIFSSIETLGSLCSSLCGLSIMNMNLLWCYFSTNSRIDRTERIALCYFSTNSWIDQTERIALMWFRTLQTIYSYVLR